MSLRRTAVAFLLVGAAFGGGLLAGAQVTRAAHARGADPYAGLEVLAEVLHTIETRHVDDVPAEVLVRGAIRGMADALDAHTAYLDPSDRAAFQDHAEGARTGVGLDLVDTGAGVAVFDVMPGGPADIAGVRPGDVLLAIDGVAVSAAEPAAERLLGERDTPVAVDLRRAEETRRLTLVRDTVLEKSVRAALLPEGIAWIQMDVFRRRAGAEVVDALARLQAEAGGSLAGVVLDLRDNPGGLLEEAVVVVDAFVSDSAIIETRDRAGHVKESHHATASASDLAAPLVVLVDGGSASAAEIVAGALQDLGRAELVGGRTYGKGSVQQIFVFEDGAGLKLTVARYYLPSGRTIPDRDGLEPDLPVAPWTRPPPELTALRAHLADLDDPDLLARLDALPVRSDPVPAARPGVEHPLDRDPVLLAGWRRVRELGE